ncbi:hypothetical protein [Methanohalophilus portucalensis]|uniref:Uncharacterized protein n=2 Tax=Methanohalophilus portucalensis TaxID=39664 RepID=A0A1L9C2Q3_9EURY|nr:hypothetical protein [Methanohalophilus portucalensis]ATU08035.1 hypothetical protein BKM01_04135 [Methanohalophilus portucalensis]OJH48767.1 hypothetical protein MPF_1814 [Methanohalophilus portucalensis FDF-1]RNI12244.1 hypothetical protein EFE41_03815 [Methanohalophilus portucalensis FDF-1]SMH43141.1 hypothetical protein SAMN06264941_1912 [Methanohalophilus portucalensis FDF-1]
MEKKEKNETPCQTQQENINANNKNNNKLYKDFDTNADLTNNNDKDEIDNPQKEKIIQTISKEYKIPLDTIREIYNIGIIELQNENKESEYISKIKEKCKVSDDDAEDIMDIISTNARNPDAIENYKQNRELEIHTSDVIFTITYVKNQYHIQLMEDGKKLGMNYSAKKSLLTSHPQRDKDIIKLIQDLLNIDREKAKQSVAELNRKISKEYFKAVDELKTNYEKYIETIEDGDEDDENEPEAWENEDIIDKANDILNNGNPYEFIQKSTAKHHAGDEDLIKMLIIARSNQSIRNSNGLQPTINGDSGSGKSHATFTFIKHIPKKYVIEGSFSDKSFFYLGLKPPMVIVSDDTEISNSMENTLKRAMSNFQEKTEHYTVNTDRESEKLILPERSLFLLNSVEMKGGDELQNRQTSFAADNSKKQDESVFNIQQRKAMLGEIPDLADDENVLICRAMFDIYAKNLDIVVIPFADKIKWNDKKNRRNFDMFLDMVKGFTMLNFRQRKKNNSGYYIATIEDFREAEKIYHKIAVSQTTKLTKAEIKMANRISINGNAGITVNELTKSLKISDTMVRKRLNTLFEKTQIYEEEGSKGTHNENTSHYVKYKKYYLPNFNPNNIGKIVYLEGDNVDG